MWDSWGRRSICLNILHLWIEFWKSAKVLHCPQNRCNVCITFAFHPNGLWLGNVVRSFIDRHAANILLKIACNRQAKLSCKGGWLTTAPSAMSQVEPSQEPSILGAILLEFHVSTAREFHVSTARLVKIKRLSGPPLNTCLSVFSSVRFASQTRSCKPPTSETSDCWNAAVAPPMPIQATLFLSHASSTNEVVVQPHSAITELESRTPAVLSLGALLTNAGSPAIWEERGFLDERATATTNTVASLE